MKKNVTGFLYRIVAIDEMWLKSYEPDLNHNSLNDTFRTHQGRRNFVENRRNLKQFATIANDNRGVLSTNFVPVGETANETYYAKDGGN